MAQRHRSAVKRHRQSLKRRARNQSVRTEMRHEIRKVREAIASNDKGAATEELRKAMKIISKAASKGVVARNTASRYISRLSRHVDKIGAAEAAG